MMQHYYVLANWFFSDYLHILSLTAFTELLCGMPKNSILNFLCIRVYVLQTNDRLNPAKDMHCVLHKLRMLVNIRGIYEQKDLSTSS